MTMLPASCNKSCRPASANCAEADFSCASFNVNIVLSLGIIIMMSIIFAVVSVVCLRLHALPVLGVLPLAVIVIIRRIKHLSEVS